MEISAIAGGGVNFWGAVTFEGTGCFRIYSENTNSDVYCNILDNYLVSTRAEHGVATIHVKLVLQNENYVDYSDAMLSSDSYSTVIPNGK